MGVSIADALFSKSKQQVLAVLFGAPDRSFYANEVIALAGVGTDAVQRELARLEAAGLVTSARFWAIRNTTRPTAPRRSSMSCARSWPRPSA